MQPRINPDLTPGEIITHRPYRAIVRYFFDGFKVLSEYPAPGRARFVQYIRDCEIEVFSHFPGSIEVRAFVLPRPMEPCDGIWTPFQMLYDVFEVLKGAWPDFGRYPLPIARLPMNFINIHRVTSPEIRELHSLKQTLRRMFPTFEPELVKDRVPNLYSEPLRSLIVSSREQRTLPSDARFLMQRTGYQTVEVPEEENDLYIDNRGKVQIQLPSGMRGEEFSEGLAIVHGKRIGCDVIDISGKTILHLPYQGVTRFSDGFAVVVNGSKRGFIDRQGEVRIPFIFDECTDFTNGLASARKDGAEWFLIDKMGKRVGRAKMEREFDLRGEFIPARINNLWGFLNRVGEIVIGPRFSDAKPFSEGLACVEIEGKYGFIDDSGELVVPAEFDYAKSFSEGLAVVSRPKCGFGFIDNRGNVKIPLRFQDAESFSDGLALVKSADHRQYIYIDCDGNPSVVPIVKEKGSLESFDNGLAVYRMYARGPVGEHSFSWLEGLINREGQVVVGPTFTHVEKFKDGLSKVSLKITHQYSDSRDYDHRDDEKSIGYIDTTGGYVYNLTLVEDTHTASEPEWSKMGYSDPSGYSNEWDD